MENPGSAPALLAISHGTSSVKGHDAVAALVAELARAHPEVSIVGGYVDVESPSFDNLVAAVPHNGSAIAVPLLLSAGYHVHVDMAQSVAGHPVCLAAALGPDDRLTDVLQCRLLEAGLREDDAVVLAAAGSSDARALEDCREAAARLSVRVGRGVTTGFLSAAKPSLHAAVSNARTRRGRVFVSSYLLAPGYFQTLIERVGADSTTDPLLTPTRAVPPELVDLVFERYRNERESTSMR